MAQSDSPQEVLYEVADHIATVTLNAPERMNTISSAMLDQMSEAFLRAEKDSDVRCVVFTGSDRKSVV